MVRYSMLSAPVPVCVNIRSFEPLPAPEMVSAPLPGAGPWIVRSLTAMGIAPVCSVIVLQFGASPRKSTVSPDIAAATLERNVFAPPSSEQLVTDRLAANVGVVEAPSASATARQAKSGVRRQPQSGVV